MHFYEYLKYDPMIIHDKNGIDFSDKNNTFELQLIHIKKEIMRLIKQDSVV